MTMGPLLSGLLMASVMLPAAVVVLALLRGTLRLDGMLSDGARHSPSRLFFTLATGVTGLEVLRDVLDGTGLPDIPNVVTAALAVSGGTYIAGKSLSLRASQSSGIPNSIHEVTRWWM